MKNKFKKKTVLVYPDKPRIKDYAFYKICYICGYKMTDRLDDDYQLAVNWEDKTFRTDFPALNKLTLKNGCLNLQCKDISKKRIQSIFEDVFGYPLAIDPLSYQGECVVKSNLNFKHDGKVIQCPIDKIDPDFVYQKLVNSPAEHESVEEIRVPYFKETIPFVCLKYRKIHDRFDNYFKAVMKRTTEIFSAKEIEQITIFCQRIGLDFGEMDILRDKDDGRIYIVDVNHTPSGPPRYLSKKEHWLSLCAMAQTFEENFVA